MSQFRKATRLEEVAAVMEPEEPLPSGDVRYQDMSAGRSSSDLSQMRQLLQVHDATSGRYAKVLFYGHRGCGKSTELLRLEHDLGERFTCLHLFTERSLERDYDYSDLFLWLVDALIRRFAEQEMPPLSKDHVDAVATWFAEVTEEHTERRFSEASLTGEGELRGKLGIFAAALGVLAGLKSAIIGSSERRRQVRQRLRSHATELVARVNRLLDEAHEVLADAGRPAELLVVVDNLDRAPPEVGDKLFFSNGDMLKALRAHTIYTVPIAVALSPKNVNTVFGNTYNLPMVKVRNRTGSVARPGRETLSRLVARRVDVGAVFHEKVLSYLSGMSGGSVRDLMQLVQYAQIAALTDGKTRIDMVSARQAVLKVQLQYERILRPWRAYMPLLARIHRTKDDYLPDTVESGQLQSLRDSFRELLFNGAVLEYNGGETWYDVHPIVQKIRAFQKAVADAQDEVA